MTVRLLAEYGDAPVGAVLALGAATEAALIAQGQAVNTSEAANWPPVVVPQYRELQPAELAATRALVSKDWNTVEPTRGAAVATAIQFRGAADTAASLGTLGLVINSASDTAAGNRLAASDADWISEINGAAASGRTRFIGPVGGVITRVHLAQLGLTAPLTDNGSGPVLAASNQMTEVNFDAALNVTALLVVEGAPTNFAGASGTGSARYVAVWGLSEVAA